MIETAPPVDALDPAAMDIAPLELFVQDAAKLVPDRDTAPALETVTAPALETKTTSDPLAFTRNGLAVEEATVAICTKSCAVVPPVDADVSPNLKPT